jgi:magnesium transporter
VGDDLGDRQLLWVDIDQRDQRHLDTLRDSLGIPQPMLRGMDEAPDRARLVRSEGMVRLTLITLADRDGTLHREGLDILAGRSLIVTVHDGPSTVVSETRDDLGDEARVGALTASAMVAALVDVCLAGYFRRVEEIERAIDELDDRALRSRGRADTVLSEMVRVRHRLGLLRRALAPHRESFAPLARPDFELHDELGEPWPGLLDRLERAIGAVESARMFLVGSFDIYMGRAAQHSNDVMKVLTLLSAVLLPAVVLAGIFGMNFQLGIFDNPSNVWLVVGFMVSLAIGILGVARWRGWL